MRQSSCLWNLFMTKIAVVTGLRLTDTRLIPSMKRIPGLAHSRERLNNMFLCEALISKPTTQPPPPPPPHTHMLLELLNHQSGVCSNLHMCLCVCVYERWYGGRVSLWQVEDCGKLLKKPQRFPASTRLSLTRLLKLLPFTFPLLSGSAHFLSVAVYSKMIYFQQSNPLVFSLCSVAR